MLPRLQINNEYVKRQLINTVHIEKCALVEHRQDGDALVRANRAVQACYTEDLFRVSGGVRGSSTQTLDEYRGPPRLTASVEAQIQRARVEHDAAQRELQGSNAKLAEAEAEARGLEQQRTKVVVSLTEVAEKL